MTLTEALKHFSIFNLDDDKMLLEIDYDRNDSCKDLYEELLHNLKCKDSELYDFLEKTEVDDKLLNSIKDGEFYENYDIDSNVKIDLLYAAWMTSKGLKYDEIEEDEWEDMYDDCKNYEYVFSDFNFKFQYETDIDMT